jgi:predicted ATP-grasp superfamily ATP-dependent carboligase
VIPELDKLAIKMLKGINYTGISEVEFMYDDTAGQYKMLEINPRTWKWHSLANIIGLNLIEQMVKYLDGLTPEPFMNKTENLAWIERLTDMWVFINEFFRGRMSVDEYIKSMRVKKESATWSKHDPWPAIFYILLSPYLFFKR